MSAGDGGLRTLRAGSDGLLAEVADLDEALALFASLRDAPPTGVWELVPAARTVLVRFDPALTSADVLAADLASRPLQRTGTVDGPVVEVPVCYDGADLAEVARICHLEPAEVVRRHTASPWTVAFTGFAPGFGYLAGGDPALDVPRRAEPRTAIPAGSVGLAGRFSGIYPRASPGGWQLIGRTGLQLWDARREEPALLAPGTRVQFVDAGPDALVGHDPAPASPTDPTAGEPALEVLTPGPLTVVVDLGRPGRAAQGVARSGAVDRGSFRRANRLVGNPSGTAALEIAAGGLQVRALTDVVVAVTGAPAALTVLAALDADAPTGTDDGERTEVVAEVDRAIALDAGAELHLGAPDRGLLSYLAVAGGVAGEPVLGSLSTDLLSGIGPPSQRAGDVVRVGAAREAAAAVGVDPGPALPAADGLTEIDVLLGPRDDWFSPEVVAAFLAGEWTLTPRSNRVGLRLEGVPLERARTDELPSEGTVPGSIQVPPTGQPVVFTADHPVTGGYPVIACVARHDLDRIGQVPVGGRVRFRAVGEVRPRHG